MAHSTALVSAGLLLLAGPVHAQANSVCDALAGVVRQAEVADQPQRITLYKSEPMTLACSLTEDPIRDGFCRAVLEGISLEFHHVYPWRIEECLRREGIRSRTKVVRADTGLRWRGRIDHLTAALAGGVRLDLRYTPETDPSEEGEYSGYYGRYDLVIWKP